LDNEINSELGKIAIADDIIATIAGIAAVECYGVVGMASRRIKDGIVELLGRENLSRGVEVHRSGAAIVVNLSVIVGYGTRITEVAKNIREKVVYAIESMSGLRVQAVNVLVQGIRVGNAE
jgi:uncharacterized alkaline shock family protein YloU